jgi:exosortase/archaeosortase family protein
MAPGGGVTPPRTRGRGPFLALLGGAAALFLVRRAVTPDLGASATSLQFARGLLAPFRFAFFGPEGTLLLALAWLCAARAGDGPPRRRPVIGALAAALAVTFALGLVERRYVADCWPTARDWTARLLEVAFASTHPAAGIIFPGEGATFSDPLIELGPITASIGEACSAAVAIGYSLLVVLFAARFAGARLRPARLPAALVLAAGGVFLLNVIRIWIIVAVAANGDEELAFGRLHDQLGLALFGAHLAGCLALLPRWLAGPPASSTGPPAAGRAATRS